MILIFLHTNLYSDKILLRSGLLKAFSSYIVIGNLTFILDTGTSLSRKINECYLAPTYMRIWKWAVVQNSFSLIFLALSWTSHQKNVALFLFSCSLQVHWEIVMKNQLRFQISKKRGLKMIKNCTEKGKNPPKQQTWWWGWKPSLICHKIFILGCPHSEIQLVKQKT